MLCFSSLFEISSKFNKGNFSCEPAKNFLANLLLIIEQNIFYAFNKILNESTQMRNGERLCFVSTAEATLSITAEIRTRVFF